MARKGKGNDLGPIALPKLIAKKKGRGGDNAVPGAARHVLEFPKPPDEVVSDKVIFGIGGDRFALHWRAEIERLPPAGPILVEQKQRQKPVRSPQKRR